MSHDAKTQAILSFLQAQAAASPELAGEYTQMEELYSRKLWHQLTMVLSSFVALPAAADHLVALFDTFVKDFKHKLNKVALARLQVAVAHQMKKDGPEAVAVFCKSAAEDASKEDPEASSLILSELARIQLEAGQVEECKTQLDKAAEYMENAGATNAVHAAYYRAWSAYYQVRTPRPAARRGAPSRASPVQLRLHQGHPPPARAPPLNPPLLRGALFSPPPTRELSRTRLTAQVKGPAHEFYKHALLLLAYEPLSQMPHEEAVAISFNLGIAALCGDNLYNFGELLEHPVINVLQETQYAWLAHILRAFNAGDIAQYEVLVAAHHKELEAQPALLARVNFLKEKITLMCLTETLFQRIGPAADRSVSFDHIATSCGKLPLNQVELLLMRALSLQLIRGSIDEVDSTCRVEWVQPRVLQKEQIKLMSERLTTWCGTVDSTLKFLETETPEFSA